jgi:hypothetical protein
VQTIPVGDALLITVPTELKRQRKISKLLVNFKLQLLSIQDNLEPFQLIICGHGRA